MFNDPPLHHKNNILADVGGKVGDTFEIMGNDEKEDRALDGCRIRSHEGNKFPEYLLPRLNDNSPVRIHCGQDSILIDKGFDCVIKLLTVS